MGLARHEIALLNFHVGQCVEEQLPVGTRFVVRTYRFFAELREALRMEVEISSSSLNGSGYWLVAFVADDSHVFLSSQIPHEGGA